MRQIYSSEVTSALWIHVSAICPVWGLFARVFHELDETCIGHLHRGVDSTPVGFVETLVCRVNKQIFHPGSLSPMVFVLCGRRLEYLRVWSDVCNCQLTWPIKSYILFHVLFASLSTELNSNERDVIAQLRRGTKTPECFCLAYQRQSLQHYVMGQKSQTSSYYISNTGKLRRKPWSLVPERLK